MCNRTCNVLVNDVDWKSETSVKASQDFAMCNRKKKVTISALYRSHVQATHVTCQLPGTQTFLRSATKFIFIFSRDNPLSNASNLLPTDPITASYALLESPISLGSRTPKINSQLRFHSIGWPREHCRVARVSAFKDNLNWNNSQCLTTT
jgi:hypothetical protein